MKAIVIAVVVLAVGLACCACSRLVKPVDGPGMERDTTEANQT